MSTERIKQVLFVAGPQWGDRSPDDIIRALDAAGYVIVPKEPTEQMNEAGSNELERSEYGVPESRMADAYRAMVKAWTADLS